MLFFTMWLLRYLRAVRQQKIFIQNPILNFFPKQKYRFAVKAKKKKGEI